MELTRNPLTLLFLRIDQTAGQGPQFLPALLKRAFRPYPFRDVLHDGNEIMRFIGLISHQRHEHPGPTGHTVLADVAPLRRPRRNLTGQKLVAFCKKGFAIVGMSDLQECLFHEYYFTQFVARITEDLTKPVVEKLPFPIDACLRDTDRRLEEGRTEARFTLSQTLFGFMPLGNVGVHANPPVYLMVVVSRRHVHRMNPSHANSAVIYLSFVFFLLAGEHLLHVRQFGFIGFRPDYLDNRAIRDFLWRQPLPSRVAAARPQKTEVTAASNHPSRHVICDELQLL